MLYNELNSSRLDMKMHYLTYSQDTCAGVIVSHQKKLK